MKLCPPHVAKEVCEAIESDTVRLAPRVGSTFAREGVRASMTLRARFSEHVFRGKTLEKRRYLDFPSDGFHDGKSLVAVTSFRGAGACLTWKHARERGR